jgi:hypothetical protein
LTLFAIEQIFLYEDSAVGVFFNIKQTYGENGKHGKYVFDNNITTDGYSRFWDGELD